MVLHLQEAILLSIGPARLIGQSVHMPINSLPVLLGPQGCVNVRNEPSKGNIRESLYPAKYIFQPLLQILI